MSLKNLPTLPTQLSLLLSLFPCDCHCSYRTEFLLKPGAKISLSPSSCFCQVISQHNAEVISLDINYIFILDINWELSHLLLYSFRHLLISFFRLFCFNSKGLTFPRSRIRLFNKYLLSSCLAYLPGVLRGDSSPYGGKEGKETCRQLTKSERSR